MKIRIEIDDKELKSTYEFETQSMERDALREKIISYLAAANIFSNPDESTYVSRDYDSQGTSWTRYLICPNCGKRHDPKNRLLEVGYESEGYWKVDRC